ncbi:MAG: peptidase M22 [Opitutaceae bacterium]|nr:peptidase M22 [Opitutaceae bacterium]
MPTVRHALSAHAPILVIDAASSRVQVGVLTAGHPPRWTESREEAGVAIFQSLEALAFNPNAAAAFIFCEGPGSILGIRTAAMALRTWQVMQSRPIYAYLSLNLVAQALRDPQLGVIADARRDTWHHFQIGRGLRRVAAGELAGRLAMPEGFRHWSPIPGQTMITPYSVRELLEQTADAELLRTTEAPDAFLHEEPSYVTWTPQIHRAPPP